MCTSCEFIVSSSVRVLHLCRFGTVEAAPKAPKTASWVPGRRFSERTRKVLVWTHLAVINAICIGRCWGSEFSGCGNVWVILWVCSCFAPH